jgi:hypothetical protein
MDYALGFFESICSRAMERVNDELRTLPEPTFNASMDKKIDYCFRTKWVRDKFSNALGDVTDVDAGYNLNKLQSKLFVENFIITMISILDHLLFRENAISRIKNIEFNETRSRLTREKIDAIISLNGPYHTKRSIQLILQTVFIY